MQKTGDERFGELRSLMNQTALDDQARQTLWALLKQTHSTDKQEYEATWLPYLQDFEHHWRTPLAKIEDIFTIPHANDIAPFATFELIITGDALPYEWREDIGALLMSEHMRSVRVLRWVKGNFLTFREDFIESTNWTNLHALALPNQHIYIDVLEELVAAPFIKQLHTLDLTLNDFELGEWEAFVQPDCWHNIRHLEIAQTGVDPHSAALLAHTPSLSNLERLNLCDNSIQTEGALELANSKHIQLVYLDIEEGGVGHEGIQALLSAPNMQRLHTLMAPWNNIGDRDEPLHLEQSKLPALKHLNLSSNDLSNTTIESILNTKWLSQLDTLDLEYNPFEDPAAALLATAQHLEGVDVIFDIDQLSKKSIKQLSKSPHLPEVTIEWLKKQLQSS